MRIVWDLDGTLADATHREHLLEGDNPDWDAFFAASDGDEPIPHAIEVFQALRGAGHKMEIWTGRDRGEDDAVLKTTLDWLREYVGLGFEDASRYFADKYFPYDGTHQIPVPVRMRPHARHGEHIADTDLKEGWLKGAVAMGKPPQLAFDDRDRVVKMWRDLGVPCFQVAPGDF